MFVAGLGKVVQDVHEFILDMELSPLYVIMTLVFVCVVHVFDFLREYLKCEMIKGCLF